jgi:hypothetical protein
MDKSKEKINKLAAECDYITLYMERQGHTSTEMFAILSSLIIKLMVNEELPDDKIELIFTSFYKIAKEKTEENKKDKDDAKST